VGRDCAVVKIPVKSSAPGPWLSLRQIDTTLRGAAYIFYSESSPLQSPPVSSQN